MLPLTSANDEPCQYGSNASYASYHHRHQTTITSANEPANVIQSAASTSNASTSSSATSSPSHLRPVMDMYYSNTTHQPHPMYGTGAAHYGMDSTMPPHSSPPPSMLSMHHQYSHSYPHAQPQHDLPMYHAPSAHLPTSLKRKNVHSYDPQHAPPQYHASYSQHVAADPMTTASSEKLCDICQYPDPILYVAKCGHRFHSRCVHIWPLEKCPVCEIPTSQLHLLKMDMNVQIDARSGKWTKAEERFIEVILTEFDRNSFPLANGTPVRLVLAKLLNCSTMRLSKKFQKNALGKRTFRIPKITKGQIAMQFDRQDHVRRQKEFSHWESIFRRELVEQFRRENNTDEGAYVETDNLRRAVKQFWISNFLKFAVMTGQSVKGLNISDSKKRKLALQMLRDGQYDELLQWNLSPTHSPTVSPLPGTSTPSPWDPSSSSSSFSTALAHASSSSASNESHMQPRAKRMRTPENVLPSTTANPSTMEPYSMPQAPLASSYGYDKMASSYMPPPTSYTAQPYSHVTSSAYTPAPTYSSMSKTTDSMHKQFPHVHQQAPAHQHSMQPYSQDYSSNHTTVNTSSQSDYGAQQPQSSDYAPEDPTSSESYSAMLLNPLPYRSNASASYETHGECKSEAAGNSSAPMPWDELLEDISESNTQVVDPALQAWSNLHIM